MLDSFILLGLPYVAVGVCVAATVARFRSSRYSVSALSSQFLESRGLRWGSTPWHVGILLILAAHVLCFLAPGLWIALMAHGGVLLAVEGVGAGLSTMCLVALIVLAVRRLTSTRVQAVTSTMDLVVLFVLLVQIALGLAVAATHRWGAAWAGGTVVPYVRSLLTLRPDPAFVVDMPPLVKAHMAVAWLLLLFVPFSRLVHVFSFPASYLVRAPQLVVWSNLGRVHRAAAAAAVDSRRFFIRGAVASAAGGGLLAVGVVDKLAQFFRGPSLSLQDQTELLEEKLTRVRATVEQRELELERVSKDYIPIGQFAGLDAKKGRYFIDYQMRPALAFKGEDGMPLLISAKCTHLGCTVGSEVDEHGRILCPCHVSYFDVKTGVPVQGAPAKDPLEHLDWVLLDPQGQVLARRTPAGVRLERDDPTALGTASLFIAKRRPEEA